MWYERSKQGVLFRAIICNYLDNVNALLMVARFIFLNSLLFSHMLFLKEHINMLFAVVLRNKEYKYLHSATQMFYTFFQHLFVHNLIC